MAGACASVQAQLLEELHLRTYGNAPVAVGGGGSSGSGAVGGGGVHGSGSRPGSPTRGSSAGEGAGGKAGSLSRRSWLVGEGLGGGSGSASGSASGAGGSFSALRVQSAGSIGVGRVASTTSGGAAASATGSSMPQYVLDALAERDQGGQGARLASLKELVGCLVQVRTC